MTDLDATWSDPEHRIESGRTLAMFTSEWYAVQDDLIGGYAVSTADVPQSAGLGLTVGSFLGQDMAEHIAALHNAWLTLLREIASPE